MEYAIVTKSREGLEVAAAEQGVDPDDVYVISSLKDLQFAKNDASNKDLTIVLGSDWRNTGVTQAHIMGENYNVGSFKYD